MRKPIAYFTGFLGFMVFAPLSEALVFTDPLLSSANTSAPTGALLGSGWQYEGSWQGCLGTTIGPSEFLTAAHIGGPVGATFFFNGSTYVTDAENIVPGTDLAIYHVIGTFSTYAPLYTGSSEIGQTSVLFGSGATNGTPIMGGFNWQGSSTERWGTNVVEGIGNASTFGPLVGPVLISHFDLSGSSDEVTLAANDSGGGLFIKDPLDGIWKIAGVHYATEDGPYYFNSGGPQSTGTAVAVYDRSDYFADSALTMPLTGPSIFLDSQISPNVVAIQSFLTPAPEPGVWSTLLIGASVLGFQRRRQRLGC